MCNEELLNLISGHIDGCNTPQEEAKLQQHLQTCAECRALLAAYEEIDHEVADLEADVPEAFHANVMQAVHALPRQQTKPRARFAFVRIAAVAAVAAVVLMAVGTGRLWDPAKSAVSVSDAITSMPADAARKAEALVDKAETCRQILIYEADPAEFSELQTLEPQIMEDGTLRYEVTTAQLQAILDACGDTYTIVDLVEDYTVDTTVYLLLTDQPAP